MSFKGLSVGYCKAITSCLNPMAKSCFMNQSHIHWLFSNALINTITLIVKFQAQIVEMVSLSNGIEDLDNFWFWTLPFPKKHVRRNSKGFETFPFYFLRFFYSNQVHHMFIIILDLQFKSLEVVKKMVGHGDAIQVVSKYEFLCQIITSKITKKLKVLWVMTIMSWLKKQNILKIWMYMVILVAQVFNFPIFIFLLFSATNEYFVVVIHISKFLQ